MTDPFLINPQVEDFEIGMTQEEIDEFNLVCQMSEEDYYIYMGWVN